jgi:hypothetical protein
MNAKVNKYPYICGLKFYIMFSTKANKIFQDVIEKYHVINAVDQSFVNSYNKDANLLEQIDPVAALKLKRQIDASNQDRTDMVEYIDSYFLEKYSDASPKAEATINTESPAWGVDRLSILALKIFHMNEEATRADASSEHKAACQTKLNILLEQRVDLSTAIDTLLEDISKGDKYMKVYKQMKMYNDNELNPVLRSQK